MMDLAEAKLVPRSDVRVVPLMGQSQGFALNERLLLLFKKLDEDLGPSNIPSGVQKQVEKHGHFPEMEGLSWSSAAMSSTKHNPRSRTL